MIFFGWDKKGFTFAAAFEKRRFFDRGYRIEVLRTKGIGEKHQKFLKKFFKKVCGNKKSGIFAPPKTVTVLGK